MAITLGLVEAVDSNGVYVSMPGSRGVLRGPYLTLQDVAVGDRVLTVTTDDGETVIVGQAAAAATGVITSGMIADGTIVNADINASAAIDRSKISGLPTTTTDNTLPKFDSTGGALQTSGIVVDDNNRLRVASGSSGGLEIGSSGVLHISGTGGPSGISAPVGSTWRQTDANSSFGDTSLTGVLWNKIGTGDTDWLPDFEGRWVAYTPTLSGCAGGTVTGRYTRTGRRVTVYCQLGLSSTTIAAGLGFSLKVPVGGGLTVPATVLLNDVTDTVYTAAGWATGSTLSVYALGQANGRVAGFTTTNPFQWANGDYVFATATYES